MKLINLLALTLAVSATNTIAQTNEGTSFTNVSSISVAGSQSIEMLMVDPTYASLTHSEHDAALYKHIESLKANNPQLSVEELIAVLDKFFEGSLSIQQESSLMLGQNMNPAYVEVIRSEWDRLNNYEKALIVSSPANAYLTKITRTKAFDYTKSEYSRNGLGDRSDAFRHAIWNALMSKYVSELWAYQFGTAHEQKSEAELNKIAKDGNREREHQKMDLHNNREGRDCWHWNDSILYTSDAELIQRVREKFKNNSRIEGQVYWLNGA